MLKLPDGFSSFERPFYYFQKIADIPHGSFHCEKAADYLVDFAKSHGLSYERDECQNVLIRKPASPGYEDHPPVILQGHTDMVAVSEETCRKDMITEGLDLRIEGDMLYAAGTSLGGDDGIFVAYALAILEDKSLCHPPIEALFTADEEVGLLGAGTLDPSWLQGRRLLNMDSEEEGIITVGCAGGIRCDCELFGEKTESNGNAFTVTISGLKGGHSGVEIDKGRINAICVLAEMLEKVDGIRLISLQGGSADNVIPSSAFATFFCSENPTKYLISQGDALSLVYKTAEPDFHVCVTEDVGVFASFDEATSKSMIRFLAETPFGVSAWSEDVPGLVETSENLGVLSTKERSLSLTVSIRSSKAAEKEKLKAALKERTEALGGRFDSRGDYPAWEYKKDSSLRTAVCDVFQKLYHRQPKIDVIHAGLECGIFAQKLEGLDAVSFGPDMKNIHSPREKLSISSSARVFDFLVALLQSL